MMKTLAFFFALIFSISALAQEKKPDTGTKAPEMKEYFFVMLKRGINRSQDSVTAEKLRAGHMAHMQKMANDGKLAIAGPFGDDGDWRGIFIFKTKTIDEARALVEKDPMIIAGRLTYEIHPWWTMKGATLD